MGFLSGAFGTNNKFQATQAGQVNPVTGQEAIEAQGQSNAAIAQQAQLLQALQGQGGLQNQSQVYNQLQGVANGTGPNPAQAMLANQTGANVDNQAALMAGQRGAGANAGLIARQAGQQGAATQQQAIGQGAAIQANQSLNAIGQAGNIANNQVANQIGATGALNQFASANRGQILGGINSQNQNAINSQNAANAINSGIAQQNQSTQNNLVGGALGSLGTAASMSGSFLGGPGTAISGSGGGGSTANPALGAEDTMAQGGIVKDHNGPKSHAGRHLMAKGGPVRNMKIGGNVPGKAKVAGNSYKNDTVDARLSPGEVVIPRSVMQSKNPAAASAKFVAAILAKKGSLK